MKRILVLIVSILLMQVAAFAQYNTPQNYNWHFGHHAAVNFSGATPTVITTSAIDADEGSAVVSDASGALLFYTDGDQIWNRNNAVMAGSAAGCAGGYSTVSCTQGALIVPDLTNANRYYVFSIEEIEDYIAGDNNACRIFYTIVDMTLNGGLGDVVAGTRATPFQNPMSEKLIAIPGNRNNIWIVTHERNTKTFRVYEMTSTGLNLTPVVSTLGYFTGNFSYGIGYIKVSPNRRMIVAQNWNDPSATGFSGTKLNGTEIYDFDPCTGIISNARTLDSTDQEYGAEFSPDSKKLYVQENVISSGLTRIAQYDVTGGTAAAIRATKYTVATNANTMTTELRLAPNGKIYFGTLTSLPPFYLSSINTPNVGGAGCGYANNTVTLSPGTVRWFSEGLPNVFQNIVPPDTTYTHQDTVACFSAGSTITLTAPTSTSGYYWYDGVTTQTHTVGSVGNYWVRLQTTCGWMIDTFRVLPGGNPITGTPTVCVGSTTNLSNSTPGGTWSSGTPSVGTIGASNGVFTGVGNGTTIVTYNTAGCSATITVTVTTVAPISGSPTLCQGGNTQLSDATAGGTWSSGTTGVATINGSGLVSGVAPGSSVITYTSAGGCFVTFTVSVGSTSPISGTLTMCNGSGTTLSNATAGGTWSSGNTGVATIGVSNGVVTSVSGGTAAITYTTPAGCISTTTVTVNAISPITGSSSLCAGGSAQMSDATTGGTWSSSNTAVATIGINTGMLYGVGLGNTVIRYSVPSGCFATYTVSIVSVVPITGNPQLCVGGTTTLSNSSIGGTWSSGNTTVATIGQNTGIAGGVTTGNAPITYTIGSCVSTTTVTVNPLPQGITGTTTTCQNTTLNLYDGTPGGTWSSSNPGVASINPITGAGMGIAGGSATITYMLPTGCYVTTIVTINPLPAAVTGPAGVCIGNTATLNSTSGGGTWAVSNGSIATIGASTGVVTGLAIGTTSVTYTLPTGCMTTTTVGVGPLPPAPVTEDLEYCQRDTVTLPLTATGTNLLWYTTATGGTALSSDPLPSTAAAGVFTWYVSQNVNGCEGPRTPLNVKIHPKAQRPLISPEQPMICQYDTMNYNYAGIIFPGIRYAWTLPGNAVLAGGTSSSQNIAVMFDSSRGRNLVTLTVSDGYAPCDVTDTVAMVVNISSPEAKFYVKPDVCIGDTITVALTHTGAGVKDFTWNFGVSGAYTMISQNSNHGGPFKIVYPDAGVHIISMVALSDAACPSKTVSDTVMVHAAPDAGIAPPELLEGRTSICIGDSVILRPVTYNYQNTYWWTPEHFFKQSNKPKEYAEIELAGYVTLRVTDPYGCTSTDQLMIDAQSCCVVSFPNAFTPNGDDMNDVFRPITVGHHTVHTLVIQNRFGQVVYQSDNENEAWDGTFGGVPQDLGVYFYYFKYDCEGKTYIMKGDVTLVR